MKVEDIAKVVSDIVGKRFEKFTEEERELAFKSIMFLIDNPNTTPAEFHKITDPDRPYKEVKQKGREKYKTIIATVKSLSALKSDEKGDYVECKTITQQGRDPNKALDWGNKGLNLHVPSTPKGTTERM